MELFGPPDVIKLKEKGKVKSLIKLLRYKKNDKVRYLATWALMELKDPRAVEPLIAAMKDRDKDVRFGAAEALGNIKDPRAVEPLIAALKDKDAFVGSYVLEELMKIGAAAVEPLIAALKDRDKDVRRYAAEALGRIGILDKVK